DDIEMKLLAFVRVSYERVEVGSNRGEVSKRGRIIDIFPVTEQKPILIDLFDREINSLRYFDPENQRSLEMIEEVLIGPATEMILSKEEMILAGARLQRALA